MNATAVRLFAAAACIAGLVGCNEDSVATIDPPPVGQLYWSLRTDIHAATVVVGGTQQLTATPRTLDGAAITGLATPIFTSGDTTKIKVDATGLVTGIAETGGVTVEARLTSDGITYVDTTIVAVTEHSAVVKSVAIQLPPGGAVLGLGDFPATISAEAVDENDDPIPGVAVSIQTLDPTRIQLFSWGGPPMAQAVSLGKARIVASTTSYGVTKTDTVEFRVQYGMMGQFDISLSFPARKLTFNPTIVLVGVGGTVTWYNLNGAGAVAVTFDSLTANIDGGNVPAFSSGTQSRRFLAAGTYTFKDPGSGATGTVLVKEQPAP